MKRREFNREVIGSLLTFSLLESVLTSDAIANEIKPIASMWLAQINSMSKDLKGQKLTQQQWQSNVEELFAQVEVNEFLEFVDFDKLTKNLKFRAKGEKSFRARFPEVDGLPTNLVFGHQMFGLRHLHTTNGVCEGSYIQFGMTICWFYWIGTQ